MCPLMCRQLAAAIQPTLFFTKQIYFHCFSYAKAWACSFLCSLYYCLMYNKQQKPYLQAWDRSCFQAWLPENVQGIMLGQRLKLPFPTWVLPHAVMGPASWRCEFTRQLVHSSFCALFSHIFCTFEQTYFLMFIKGQSRCVSAESLHQCNWT